MGIKLEPDQMDVSVKHAPKMKEFLTDSIHKMLEMNKALIEIYYEDRSLLEAGLRIIGDLETIRKGCDHYAVRKYKIEQERQRRLTAEKKENGDES